MSLNLTEDLSCGNSFIKSELFDDFLRYKIRILLDCRCFYVYIIKQSNSKEEGIYEK